MSLLGEITTTLESVLLANVDDGITDTICAGCGVFDTSAVEHSTEASIVMYVPGGHVRYYDSDKRFEATCYNRAHWTDEGRPCRVTRTGLGGASVGEGDAPNGRPLGTLVAWLADGEHLLDRIQHRNVFYIASLGIGKRKAARDLVREHPEGENIFRDERKQRIGEEEEPSSFPMGY